MGLVFEGVLRFRRTVLRTACRTAVAALLPFVSVQACAGANGSLLALGDSVVFGFTERKSDAYHRPDIFIGYPQLVGSQLQLKAVNASCPGETTASFTSATAVDNGCRAYRATNPLHVKFDEAQSDFARHFLTAHSDVRLVTISLGANDVFLLNAACHRDAACVRARMPALVLGMRDRLKSIIRELQATQTSGVFVVVNYYSLDYNDAAQTENTAALNQALADAASSSGALLADAFTAFRRETTKRGADGDTCKAGLLATSERRGCDVHPSSIGQRLLANVVIDAYEGRQGAND